MATPQWAVGCTHPRAPSSTAEGCVSTQQGLAPSFALVSDQVLRSVPTGDPPGAAHVCDRKLFAGPCRCLHPVSPGWQLKKKLCSRVNYISGLTQADSTYVILDKRAQEGRVNHLSLIDSFFLGSLGRLVQAGCPLRHHVDGV